MERRDGNIYRFFFLLLISPTFVHPTDSDPVKSESVLKYINFCATVKFVEGSHYMEVCKNTRTPVPFNTNDTRPNLAMCLVVADIMRKVCLYQSVSHLKPSVDIKLPQTATEFDRDLEELDIQPGQKYEDVENDVCDTISTLLVKLNKSEIKTSPEIVPYFNFVSDTMKKSNCHYNCHSYDGKKLNPICTIFLWANKILSSMSTVTERLSGQNLLLKTEPVPDGLGGDGSKLNQINNHHNDNAPSEKQLNQKPNVKIGPADVDHEKIKKVEQDTIPNDPKKTNEEVNSQGNNNKKILVEEKPKIPETKVNVPSSTSGKVKTVVPKQENVIENIQQSGDENLDNSALLEDHHNKKENENDADKGIEHDETIDNDPKESMSNFDNQKFLEDSDAEQRPENDLPNEKYSHSSLMKEEDESHFFTYFSVITLLFIGLYLVYHNKQKILAIVLEGRRSRRSRGSRGSRRRPSTASYRKLDCNLEEAVTSQCNANVTNVIY